MRPSSIIFSYKPICFRPTSPPSSSLARWWRFGARSRGAGYIPPLAVLRNWAPPVLGRDYTHFARLLCQRPHQPHGSARRLWRGRVALEEID